MTWRVLHSAGEGRALNSFSPFEKLELETYSSTWWIFICECISICWYLSKSIMGLHADTSKTGRTCFSTQNQSYKIWDYSFHPPMHILLNWSNSFVPILFKLLPPLKKRQTTVPKVIIRVINSQLFITYSISTAIGMISTWNVEMKHLPLIAVTPHLKFLWDEINVCFLCHSWGCCT